MKDGTEMPLVRSRISGKSMTLSLDDIDQALENWREKQMNDAVRSCPWDAFCGYIVDQAQMSDDFVLVAQEYRLWTWAAQKIALPKKYSEHQHQTQI